MPRITHQKSAAQAKTYYEVSDYYESGPDALKGHWFGQGAAMLGLHGEVDKQQFDRIVDNRHPFENTPLTPRLRDDRRVGADITFSAPKSVSIAWGITQDQRIADAVLESARETLSDMERDAQTRVNTARHSMHLEKTNVLLGATWLHTTSRPVDGHPDPNLHAHGWIANATHTGSRWTALDMSAIVRDSKYYEGLFQARLATKMQDLKYAVERSEHNFEIKGISRATIEKFSRRTAEIEQKAAELGIKDADAKDRLGATTRQKKSNTLDPRALPAIWKGRLNEREVLDLQRVVTQSFPVQKAMSAKQAVDYAKDHLFERQSVVRERQLLTEALFRGMGDASVNEVLRESSLRPWLREGHDDSAQISTNEILQEERKLLYFARNGRGAEQPLVSNHVMRRNWLSKEQKAAVRGILGSTDTLQMLHGPAGTGKTSMLLETVEAVEENGKSVLALAPTAEAVGVLQNEGFDATTLASFLLDEQRQQQAVGQVLLVDEAGLIGTPTLCKLTELAQRIHARIILSGDSKQNQPVERGHGLRLLEEQAGIRPWELTDIRRQQGDYKRAVTALSKGNTLEGFDRLNALGFVHHLSDDIRHRQLAKDYADARVAGKSTLVIAPTHVERDLVTETLRHELKERGIIHGVEHQLATLKPRNLTMAERSDPLRYAPGDVIEFTAKGKGGFRPGDRLKVTEADASRVLASGAQGVVTVPLSSSGAFDVFRPDVKPFAIGDTIRITRNRRSRDNQPRLTNGSTFRITGFTPKGDIKLDNKTTLQTSFAHFDHGICLTAYSSQGKTIQRTFVAQGSQSFPASSPEQAYVSASRSRERVDIYSDDVDGLRMAIQRSRPKTLASELNQNPPPQNVKHRPRLRQELSRLWQHSRKIAVEQMRWLHLSRPKPEPEQPQYAAR